MRKSQELTLESIADKVDVLHNMDRQDILSKGRQRSRVEARSLFCHIAVRDLEVLARHFGMVPSAISYAVTRGRKIAEGKCLESIMDLLNN